MKTASHIMQSKDRPHDKKSFTKTDEGLARREA